MPMLSCLDVVKDRSRDAVPCCKPRAFMRRAFMTALRPAAELEGTARRPQSPALFVNGCRTARDLERRRSREQVEAPILV